MRVVIDTNIYLSALILPGSKPDIILRLAKEGKYSAYTSNFILDELRRILIAKFAYDTRHTAKVVDEILKFAIVVAPKQKVGLIKEKADDNKILACAMEAKADYLVTGDKKHILPIGMIGQCKIVSATEFIKHIR